MYNKILLPIDLAHESSWRKAVPVAKMLAGASDATIHCISIVPDIWSSMVGQYFPQGYEEKAVQAASEALSEFANANLADVSHEVHVVEGTVYQQILDAAARLKCDLIVMASHRPELADYLIGPNAEKVVRHSKISVMVVRD